jgi:hypothetical protein
MPDPTTVSGITAAARIGAEVALPALAPFDPLIALISTAIIAHFNATKTWPTPEQVQAALPADYQQLVLDWNAWKPSGDGTLKTP